MMKKLMCVITALLICVSLCITSFAADTPQKEFLQPTIVECSNPDVYPPNLISVESKPRKDGTGIDVAIGNLGIDPLDLVTVTATDHPIPQTQSASAFPIIGKTFKFDIPMTKCDMRYYINVTVTDGTQTQYYTRNAGLEYSEEILAAMDWGRGTFSTRQASVNHHFSKHSGDIGVKAENIVEYLSLAIDTFNDTLYNPEDYKIVAQKPNPAFEAAHKYTHKTNYRFIIYGDDTDTIYTFGGKG